MLHGEFNHVGAGQADGVLRRVLLVLAMIQGAHAQQRRHVGNAENSALFGLRAAGADFGAYAGQFDIKPVAQQVMERAVGKGLQNRPQSQVGKVVVYQAQRDAVNAAQGAQVDDVIAFINGKGFGTCLSEIRLST